MLENDPERLKRECNMSDEDLETLKQLSAAQVEFFANTLRSKRREEVAKMLPRTVEALGGQHKLMFNRYMATYLPSGDKKHLEDALRFAYYLETHETPNKPWIGSIASYERAWLEITSGRKRFIARRLFYDIDAMHDDSRQPVPVIHIAMWANSRLTGVRHWIIRGPRG
jgi:hypothetical protein